MDAHALAHRAIDELQALPAWLSFTALSASAGLEYIVPPFPGDTVSVVGGALVAQGVFPAFPVIAALTCGSMIGTALAYSVGLLTRTHPRARKLFHRFVSEQSFEKTAASYRKWGRWLLVANRFLPGLRATFIFSAGLFRVSFAEVMVLGGISALVWNTMLVAVGHALGANLDAMIDFLDDYAAVAWVVVAGVSAAALALWWWKRRARAV